MYRTLLPYILFFLSCVPVVSNAQFVSATLGVNGLTCSMCSYAVQAELERLPFVKNANLDLNTNIAKITFKDSTKVNMHDLVEAVYRAGFSVGYTEADYVFHKMTISNQFAFSYEGEIYEFLKPSLSIVNGRTTIKFIDKKFIAKKGYSFWAPLIKESLNGKTNNRIYHITL